ncbi:MAG: GTP-binding protein [Hyphomicrobiaceae bacterium]|nr:GTP-binding protein [Hyphomicrobiaceae bacterium]
MTARKVMLLGEIGVGKTSLVRRLVDGRFDGQYQPTLGADVYTYDVPETRLQPPVTLILWDTDGNFGESIFTHIYIREAAAALVVGDVTRADTLRAMAGLGRGFLNARPGRHLGFILNKLDLVVGPEPCHIGTIAATLEAPVARTSAKTGSNVLDVFHETAATIVRRGL